MAQERFMKLYGGNVPALYLFFPVYLYICIIGSPWALRGISCLSQDGG